MVRIAFALLFAGSVCSVAQAAGAEIFATASPGKWELLKSQGIQHVMNSRTLEFRQEVSRRSISVSMAAASV